MRDDETMRAVIESEDTAGACNGCRRISTARDVAVVSLRMMEVRLCRECSDKLKSLLFDTWRAGRR